MAPEELLLGEWVAEDGTKSMRILRAAENELRVTVWGGLGENRHADGRPAFWNPPAGPERRRAQERLGYLCVELGPTNLGTTYQLMAGTANSDLERWGDYAWRQLTPDTPRHAVRLFPEGGGSYYEAVLGPWDDFVEALNECDDWVEPLSTYRPATPSEAARLPAPKEH